MEPTEPEPEAGLPLQSSEFPEDSSERRYYAVPGGYSASFMSVISTDKFALSQSDARILVV